ncbi:SnoaL-like domain-containing protein [Rosenbergiella australiborealis]|uniref:SnoaL-like domain-containing protein n=2 Tax=Rosenbergiella TaxID=1356488 RepID=A0ABS5T282_9GAMM|nr:aromatic-ring-hydroxylating dioxygenase subunit beta [Rosenbergiella australiborealis]MBT0726441.1 SnoaL-like domain-containing protein [Rosenbergiella australiborealis]
MSQLLLEISQFLYREARLLDDREWDEWIKCYHPKVVYWMPAWGDDDLLTVDPYTDMSLIYYPSREGLEDRIYRIKTERSAASTPEPRTTHFLSNIEVLEENNQTCTVRYNWCTHSHRYQQSECYFGHAICQLTQHELGWQIMSKKIQLNNDYIHQVIDIYHL